MKIVIDIDENIFKKIEQHEVYPYDVDVICNAILSGKPLPEHLNKMKDEIDLKRYIFMANNRYDEGVRFGLMMAYQIIDKHLEGSDNE